MSKSMAWCVCKHQKQNQGRSVVAYVGGVKVELVGERLLGLFRREGVVERVLRCEAISH